MYNLTGFWEWFEWSGWWYPVHCCQAVTWRSIYLKAWMGMKKKNAFKMASPMTVGRKPQFPPLAVQSRPVFSPQGLSKALLGMFSWQGSWLTWMNNPREGGRRKPRCLLSSINIPPIALYSTHQKLVIKSSPYWRWS